MRLGKRERKCQNEWVNVKGVNETTNEKFTYKFQKNHEYGVYMSKREEFKERARERESERVCVKRGKLKSTSQNYFIPL